MKNNSWAMLATISAVAALASMIGYIDPKVCVVEAAASWMSCEAVAAKTLTLFWGLTGVSVISFVGYLIQKRRAKLAKR
jgi:hypothetical protein